MSKHIYTLLCLGDSYTIGEGVPLHQSFPYQLVARLRRQGLAWHAPEVVAQTGWTTFELADHLLHAPLLPHYDFVTLLIGVNNQYRGLPLPDYSAEFAFLLKKALHYAQQQAARVLVLSIPDWGITPFAADRNAKQIAEQIDQFNREAQQMALANGVHWIDITAHYRQAGAQAAMLAADGLHPSGLVYAHWAQCAAAVVVQQVA